ncbi:MAG: 50S ribosomal protein L23 [Acidobacteriota bacterium]|nr:50S ribosomal protein L23 [Acidobacteriota bacterium]
MKLHDIIKRPLITEKGTDKKDTERTLCFEVATGANKVEVRAAVEKLFSIKVEEVRTSNFEGKLRRRGKFSGYRSDWKKAYVKLRAGQKIPEFTDI